MFIAWSHRVASFLSFLLNKMGKSAGHLKVKKLWNDSMLDWSDFIASLAAVQEFCAR